MAIKLNHQRIGQNRLVRARKLMHDWLKVNKPEVAEAAWKEAAKKWPYSERKLLHHKPTLPKALLKIK